MSTNPGPTMLDTLGWPAGCVIIITGGPRSGKGTQAANVAAIFGGLAISSGDLMRQLHARNQLGVHADIMTSGGLVPEALFQSVMAETITAVPLDQPIILDGVAKKPAEAPWLLGLLERLGRRVMLLVHLDSDYATMLARNIDRGGRADDSPEKQAERWRCYQDETTLSVAFFKGQLPWTIEVDGRQPAEAVWDAIREGLRRIPAQGAPAEA